MKKRVLLVMCLLILLGAPVFGYQLQLYHVQYRDFTGNDVFRIGGTILDDSSKWLGPADKNKVDAIGVKFGGVSQTSLDWNLTTFYDVTGQYVGGSWVWPTLINASPLNYLRVNTPLGSRPTAGTPVSLTVLYDGQVLSGTRTYTGESFFNRVDSASFKKQYLPGGILFTWDYDFSYFCNAVINDPNVDRLQIRATLDSLDGKYSLQGIALTAGESSVTGGNSVFIPDYFLSLYDESQWNFAVQIRAWDDFSGYSNDHTRIFSDFVGVNRIASVPESASFILIGIGLIGLAGYQRKKIIKGH